MEKPSWANAERIGLMSVIIAVLALIVSFLSMPLVDRLFRHDEVPTEPPMQAGDFGTAPAQPAPKLDRERDDRTWLRDKQEGAITAYAAPPDDQSASMPAAADVGAAALGVIPPIAEPEKK